MDEEIMKNMALMLWMGIAFVSFARSQDEVTAQKLFSDAIETMGGETFLKVTDVMSEGNYFGFNRDGDNTGLIKYVDYTRFPDKSRNEMGNHKSELDISIFNLEKNEGWIVKGQKPLRKANDDEMKEFKNVVKHNLDNIFRFRIKDPQNKIFYIGPGEELDMTLETVKIVDPENDETTIYFDRMSKLPAKIEYRTVTKKGVRQRIVDEFSQWHVIQGVNTPMRIDSYINGKRASLTFAIKISYNTSLQDSLFSKPPPPKK
jgi:hypothetical protein